jgi:hypothetical protein
MPMRFMSVNEYFLAPVQNGSLAVFLQNTPTLFDIMSGPMSVMTFFMLPPLPWASDHALQGEDRGAARGREGKADLSDEAEAKTKRLDNYRADPTDAPKKTGKSTWYRSSSLRSTGNCDRTVQRFSVLGASVCQ